MSSNRKLWLCGMGTLFVAGGLLVILFSVPRSQDWAFIETAGNYASLEIAHPIEGAVMPKNMPGPVVLWRTNLPGINEWIAGFKAGERKWLFRNIQSPWRPEQTVWHAIKQAANGNPVELHLAGLSQRKVQARHSIRFMVSTDTVEAPLFFREVNLPFAEAVKDPSRIRWRFGPIDTGVPPPIVLEKLPVCGNCHSFSRNGEYLAMDVDYANNKGSYIITKTGPDMRLATSDIITWDDYKRSDGQQTFGLLSQISPDGRYVVSTVKDRSVFIPRPDLAFSQLFFPLKGILAVYDRETKQFFSLPGADDPAFVQSNPSWSPDGQWILFARTRAAEVIKVRDTGSILLSPEECEDFLKAGLDFRYDIYRVPFNGGRGGQAEPLRGASANGRSNYFPKYSPNGQWIVFCQSTNYMLLRPDSELFILPAEGGEAKRLGCNLSLMNSWHSWSPDGRWLVFASKTHSLYTQLYLTRMTEQGTAHPPVWLAHLVEPGRAANIPEFVALAPNGIAKIHEQFLDDYSHFRAGDQFFRAGDADRAIEKYQLALSMNSNNAVAHQRIGFLLQHVKKQPEQALEHVRRALQLDPRNAFAHFDLGLTLARQGLLSNAVPHLAEAVRLLPNGYDEFYNATAMNHVLADAYYRLGRFAQSIPVLEAVLKREPANPDANYLIAMAKVRLGETELTRPYYEQAVRGEPLLAGLPDYADWLSQNYLTQGKYAEALRESEKAAPLARAIGRAEQAAALQGRIEHCRKKIEEQR